MKLFRGRRGWMIGAFAAYTVLALAISVARGVGAAEPAAPAGIGTAAVFNTPTYSSPIALSQDGAFVWSVNPDDDSVSVIRTDTDELASANIRVGDEPQSIALDPNNGFAYVANAADNSVSVIRIVSTNPFQAQVVRTYTTGAEPWNIVISPNGNRVFVANSVQDTITVIKADVTFPTLPSVLGNVPLNNTTCNGTTPAEQQRHFQPRGLAVTADSSKLYVTSFLSFTKPGGTQGTDDGKQGVVCRLDITTTAGSAAATVTGFTRIVLAAQDTGFPATVGGAAVATKAYPNQMQSVVICGTGANARAYMPNIAASPAGPLKFDVDTHAFVNMIDGVNGASQADRGALNLHVGAQGNTPKIFFANAWAFACNDANSPTTAYAVSAGSDGLVKLNVASDGALSFTDGATSTKFIDLNPGASTADVSRNNGKNPLGIVIRPGSPAKAYVMNYISRNVSVVDLSSDSVVKAIAATNLPPPGSQEEQLLVGAEIFFSSRGKFDRPAGTTVSTANRLSFNGWQNCASCHFAGLTDGNIWIFGAGPRKSVPLNGTWSPHNPDDQRILNYSAIFDEVEDFEANIRNVSGPGFLNPPTNTIFNPNQGLLISDTGDINSAPAAVPSLGGKANANRPQHNVTLPGSSKSWPALTAMKEWVRFAVRTPNGALTTTELTKNDASTGRTGGASTGGLSPGDVSDGRRLFFRAGCHTCHGGTKWTISSKDFTSPPAAAEIATETNPPPQGVTPIGTPFLHRFLRDIASFNLGVPGKNKPVGGTEVGAFERANAANITGDAGPVAIGTDHNQDGKGEGYNIPSLLGIWHLPPYYHNGSCETLACVLSNQAHRTIKGTRPDVLASQIDQLKVVEFLKSLDADTPFPFNLYIDSHDIFFEPRAVFAGQTVTVGANISLFGTRQDLLDIIGSNPLTVKFTGPNLNSEVTIPAADIIARFGQDFGQAKVTTTWNVPANVGFQFITVEVDSGKVSEEDKENDNTRTRRVFVRAVPPDTTPPRVDSVAISDDVPFNPNDPITGSREVKVNFKVTNLASSGAAPTTDLDAFCIVRYSYSKIQRRWVEEKCDFRRLPAPEGDGSFTVNTRLPERPGVAYTFVYVKDVAGNISKPGFDFISFLPIGANISLDRNDVRVFRIKLDPGQSLTLTFAPSFGDVDVTVFQDGARIPVPIQNGLTPEVVTLPNTGGIFQLEVRGVVNSRFQVGVSQTLSGQQQVAPSGGGIGPAKEISEEPLVSGPPSLDTAIDAGSTVFMPLAAR